jgi:XisI protein
MDSLIKYKKIAHKVVSLVVEKISNLENYEAILSIDPIRGQYLVMSDGWDGIERNYATLVHIEVKKDAKVWLRIDATDLEIGKELLKEGVLPSDLVLAFHSSQMRKYADYSFA